MIRFFTSIGGFLLGALLFAFLLTISFNPNFFAKVMLKDFAKSMQIAPNKTGQCG